MLLQRFFSKTLLLRHSHLAVVVMPSESAAFQAYRLLQSQGISPEHLAIVGEGYSSPERVGLRQPIQIAMTRGLELSVYTGALGSLVGFGLLLLSLFHHWFSGFTLLLIMPTTSIVLGFWGAVVGALVGLVGEGNIASIYRHHLRQGRYLLMMEGPERLIRLSQQILSQYSVPRAY